MEDAFQLHVYPQGYVTGTTHLGRLKCNLTKCQNNNIIILIQHQANFVSLEPNDAIW